MAGFEVVTKQVIGTGMLIRKLTKVFEQARNVYTYVFSNKAHLDICGGSSNHDKLQKTIVQKRVALSFAVVCMIDR